MSVITNVTTSAILAVDGGWTLSSNFPALVDEIIIRQITYLSSNANRHTYLIRCDINQQIIGSVLNVDTFISCPNTVIRPKGPLQSTIGFQLVETGGGPGAEAGDQISISMDFIKHL